MNRFAYVRVTTLADALDQLAIPGSQVIAGGMDLVPLLRDNLAAPRRLVDIARISDLDAISFDAQTGLRLGATARLTDVMRHPEVQARYPVLSQAIAESASPQIRNLATIGGNLLQKPRCAYYRDGVFACLRRDGGDVCSALEGNTEKHALFGGASRCVAVHPSDAVNALAVGDASVVLRSPNGERAVPIEEFFYAPAADATRETVIAPDEIIIAITMPPPPANMHGAYIKLRDRAAYEFAIVSAAAVIATTAAVVTHARLTLGGVAWGPYRALAAEAALLGQPLTTERIAAVAQMALAHAEPLPDNAYKIPMAQAALRRALANAAASTPTGSEARI